jgi:flagellar assembly factor FliW
MPTTETATQEKYKILDLKANQIFTFSAGIPGFERVKQYCLLRNEEEYPFLHLVAVGSFNLEFIVVLPWVVVPGYDAEISKDKLAVIDSPSKKELILLSIVNVAEPFEASTVNLVAPLIINAKTSKGSQVLIDNADNYSCRHSILLNTG